MYAATRLRSNRIRYSPAESVPERGFAGGGWSEGTGGFGNFRHRRFVPLFGARPAPALANIPTAMPLENGGPAERPCSKLQERRSPQQSRNPPRSRRGCPFNGESRMIRLAFAA